MKYVVVLGDGMADEPIEALGGKTPLDYANTPNMDSLSKLSEIGMVHTIPDGMNPGSDTANLSVMGYDPRKYYSGRSPLEALSIGVPMKDTDIAIRCNIVTISEEDVP
ncbi:MAG: phosphoglycerate mutase, partial [Lachnospiraceae bacterium]|nr:phosphoglycerate mutase [Lachnospiraceae bacterium]